MISTLKYKKLTWIDLESPTQEEIKTLVGKYSIHPLVAEELLKPTVRPKVDTFPDFTYLVLHFPVFDYERKGCVSCEIDFVIGKDVIVTVHYQTISFMHEISKVFEADALLKKGAFTQNTGLLFFQIVKQFYSFSLRQIDHIQGKTSDIEDKMFAGVEYNLVKQISLVRRDILDFRRIIHPHKEVFNSFEFKAKEIFGKEFEHYFSNLVGEYYKIWHMLESSNETIESLQETVDSLLSHKSNEVMKTMTIMAFVTFPLVLFANIFSMNTVGTPIVGVAHDFWIIIGVMVIATFFMFTYFKKRKWL